MKEPEKEKAIYLRRKGLSYSEILKRVPVARSTLSLWLRSVGLSKRQKQRLTEKKWASIRRGWLKWHQIRVDKTRKIVEQARREIGKLSQREPLLIGTSLYWAEGSKEKEYAPGQGIRFSNSDPAMIRVFLDWLRTVLKVKEEDIIFEIYIHENSQNDLKDVIKYWAEKLRVELKKLNRVYFKRNKIRTKRKNIGEKYYGLLMVRVRKSSALYRKILGWIKGIDNNYSGVG